MRHAPSDRTNPLDYAPRPSSRARWRKRLATAAIIILTLLIVGRITPVAWRQYQLLRLQKQCMTHTAPAGQVVWTSQRGSPSIPQAWSQFSSALSSPGIQSEGTLFLHERISPAGHRRLVAVDSGGFLLAPGILDAHAMTPRIYVPGTPFSQPQQILGSSGPLLFVRIAGADTIHAGQPDPKDPSHFTIQVMKGTTETTIDGWLRDNDTVLLQPRPATPVPTTQPQESN